MLRAGLTSLDVQFEEEVARNPYVVKLWWSYIQTKLDQPPALRFTIYERALAYLPRSYKLWHAYLMDFTKVLSSKSIKSRKYELLVQTYERALAFMNKMPRIWLDYCQLLISLKKGTATRKAFDRALQALPITQHKDMWKAFITWAKDFGVMQTTIRVFRRYLMFDPMHREEFIFYLEEIEQYEEAARQLAICLNDEHFTSPSGQTHHQIWMHLCELCARHAQQVSHTDLDVDAIIRSGLTKFSDEVGRLWTSLADYYIRLGQFETSRDVYEEALSKVTTVRDFTIIFDAYVKVEETILTAKIRFLHELGEEDQDDENNEEDKQDVDEVSLRIARLEHLLERRPLLLNSVLLRQNPHNIAEWHKRVKLLESDGVKSQLRAYAEAVQSIDPKEATNGKFSSIWLAWARLYEQQDDWKNASVVMQKAIMVAYRSTEELANVYCGWAEQELRHDQPSEAHRIMQRAVEPPAHTTKRAKALVTAAGGGDNASINTAADRVHRSTQVWALYLDLEEALGTVTTVKAAYDRALELKILTAAMALHYAEYLEELHYYEDAFKVYEKSVALFDFPVVKPLWIRYLDRFEARYEGTKLERLRELHETVVSRVPETEAAEFYLRYAKIEEKYGLSRHVVAVYERAVTAVPEGKRLSMYKLYIKKVELLFGAVRTRAVYEKALQVLPDAQAMLLALDFAELERKLGEIDRARAVYTYASQWADPRREAAFWQAWRSFEEAHGNEETFRDLLRIQRSVGLAFAHVQYLAADLNAAASAAGGAITGGITHAVPATMTTGNKPVINTMDMLAARAEADAMEEAALAHSAAEGGADEEDDQEQLAGLKRKFFRGGGQSEEKEGKVMRRNEEELDI